MISSRDRPPLGLFAASAKPGAGALLTPTERIRRGRAALPRGLRFSRAAAAAAAALARPWHPHVSLAAPHRDVLLFVSRFIGGGSLGGNAEFYGH